MQPDSPKYLEDIRDAAEFVLEETREYDLSHYLENRLVKMSDFEIVEHNFSSIDAAQ